ncbi:hypothetical protein BDV3_005263 [Batrachochytrium dendrobatidis]|nr:chitin synthase [Batrachochytrium dendrobatidis JEL423]
MTRPGRKPPVGKYPVANSNKSMSNTVCDLSLHRIPPNEANSKPIVDTDSISHILVQKLHSDKASYTWIGDSVLVAARPIVPVLTAVTTDTIVEQLSKDRAAKTKSLGFTLLNKPSTSPPELIPSLSTPVVEPHLFDLAGSAFVHLLNDKQDQCIFLCGNSNSGKSESGRLIARHLSDLSRNTVATKKPKVHSAAIKLDHVLSVFGNAVSPQNINGSHFSRYTEYQFNDDGSMVGVKLLAYNLQKQRVTDASHTHANFNVFYYLLSGADQDMRTKFHLAEASHFYFLNRVQSKPAILSHQHHFDPENLNRLVDHLKALGIPKKAHMDIFQLLAGILHLGNINFVRTSDYANQACEAKNYQHVQIAATLLGLKPEHLLSTLTFETRAVGRELCTMILDVDGAIRQRDTLAQLLYSLLFQWIIEQINTKYCKEESEWTRYISVVDFQGIQTSSPGLGKCLARLVSNYAAERVQGFVVSQLTAATDRLVAEHAIKIPPRSRTNSALSLVSNSDVLHLLAAPATGVISILQNEYIRRETSGLPGAGSSTANSINILERIASVSCEDPKLITYTSPRKQFGIRHYNGVVNYEVFQPTTAGSYTHGSIATSVGYNDLSASTNISTDFISLFCGSMDQPAAQFSLVRQLFSKRSIAVDLHPKNRITLLRARLSLMTSRRPSTLRKRNTIRLGAPHTVSSHTGHDKDATNETMSFMMEPSILNADMSMANRQSHLVSRPNSLVASMNPSTLADGAASLDSQQNFLLSQTQLTMDDLLDSFLDTNLWFAMHICPNSNARSTGIDVDEVTRQVQALQLDAIANSMCTLYTCVMPFETLWSKIESLNIPNSRHAVSDSRLTTHAKDSVHELLNSLRYIGITDDLFFVGDHHVFFTELGSRRFYSAINSGYLLLEQSAVGMPLTHETTENNGASLAKNSHIISVESNQQPLGDVSDDGNYENNPTEKLIQKTSDNKHQQKKWRYRKTASMAVSTTSMQPTEDDPYEIESMYDFTYAANEKDKMGSISHETVRRSFTNSDTVLGHLNDPLVDTKERSAKAGSVGAIKKTHKTENKNSLTPPKPRTFARKSWLCCTWSLTWWIPTCLISCLFGKRRPDVQIAWREKVALCTLIFLMCATMLFLIVGLGQVLCPKQNILSEGEVSTHNSLTDAYVIINGNYYDIKDIVKSHVQTSSSFIGSAAFVSTVLGRDVSAMFYPANLPQKYCPNMRLPAGWDSVYQRNNQGTPQTWYYHTNGQNPSVPPPDYIGAMTYMKKGQVARSSDWMSSFTSSDSNHKLIVAWGRVYDISTYYDASNVGALGDGPGFFGPLVKQVFDAFSKTSMAGRDATSTLNQLIKPQFGGPVAFANFKTCMDNLFMTGTVDTRDSIKCVLPNYIMLTASVIMVAVIGFKFLGALQLTSKVVPESHSKFVICQVPCYTEDETSLKKTIDSIARTQYDDKHKLLFIVCDGMIIGAGNDRPTPRIVLDILGVDSSIDPDTHSFQSIGAGLKEHNMGKVYSGLYETEGRFVPFIVVIKVGTPAERNRPGNRGKRDSQMVLMRFLNRIHFNAPMAPLELELMHHMKNIIGVHPSLYEYVLMVDADTEVLPDSLNLLVSSMIVDARVMGICGETQLANEQESWVTMIQVYEYYISHHLAKAFESLFGTVTCLPGCFCMYRIRSNSASRQIPLLVSPQVINDYSENNVDTLHMKNLLELGEDRYLTTIMLKHFPTLKTKFASGALCRTGAPEKWSVFLSQRRRWINSTVHNLFELVFLSDMCGVCCFSMRFVVFLDLFATFLQPSALIYIVYLIYAACTNTSGSFPTISLIMLATIYGLQMIIFILKREWQHVGWMIIYLLAMPVFGFYVPLYAFWHFDDFSWGNTRMVVGDNGKSTAYAADAGETFDPSLIPLQRWDEVKEKSDESQNVRSKSVASYSDKSSLHYAGIQRPPPTVNYESNIYDSTVSQHSMNANGMNVLPEAASMKRAPIAMQQMYSNPSQPYGQRHNSKTSSQGSGGSHEGNSKHPITQPAAYYNPLQASAPLVFSNIWYNPVKPYAPAASSGITHDTPVNHNFGGNATSNVIYPPQHHP